MKIFVCLLLIIILYKVRFYGKNEFNHTPLSQKNVVPIRGILAFEVVLGHLYGVFDELNCFYLNNRMGVWAVALFMFLSGYGLMKSKNSKPDYMRLFLWKRLFYVLLPVFVSFVFAVLLNYSNSLVSYVLNDWFVVEITILYIVWFVVFKFMSQRDAIAVLGVAICVLNGMGTYFDIGSRWYGSTACFLVGILFEKYEVKIKEYFVERYLIRSSMLILLWGCFSFLFIYFTKYAFVSTILINITAILLCFLMYCFLLKVKNLNNILVFLGIISWDIYVTHRIVINIFRTSQPNNVLWWMVFFSIAIVVFGALIYGVCNVVLKGTKYISNKKSLRG